MKKLFQLIKNILAFFKALFFKPSARFGLGILILIGFIAGIISWQKFNDILEQQATEEFCISCHSMQQPYEELKQTVHWSNASGVTATCSSCHLPHDKTAKFARKVQASTEIWAELSGKYDDPKAFEEHRRELAEKEWARFAANGSKECKACHKYERMNFSKMSLAAQKAMIPAAKRDQSCVDCHKGIAHHLPQRDDNANIDKFGGLVVTSLKPEQQYYTKGTVAIFDGDNFDQIIGHIEGAVPVTFIKAGKNADLVQIDMWRKKKGFGRVWYNNFGINIVNATFSKEFMQSNPKFEVISEKEDELTGLTWQNVKLQIWLPKSSLISDIHAVWQDAAENYKTQCSTCHRQPEIAHFDANTWIGLFNGMVGFTNMDKQTSKEVLRYLQLHSSTFEQHNSEKK